mmetsp:Transcript_14257/g.44845  ORF Transcript_14257/g.44845 Transcript_14257/m.44845 type:complete len:491 (-) Transcript_14257:752-2224(-)
MRQPDCLVRRPEECEEVLPVNGSIAADIHSTKQLIVRHSTGLFVVPSHSERCGPDPGNVIRTLLSRLLTKLCQEVCSSLYPAFHASQFQVVLLGCVRYVREKVALETFLNATLQPLHLLLCHGHRGLCRANGLFNLVCQGEHLRHQQLLALGRERLDALLNLRDDKVGFRHGLSRHLHLLLQLGLHSVEQPLPGLPVCAPLLVPQHLTCDPNSDLHQLKTRKGNALVPMLGGILGVLVPDHVQCRLLKTKVKLSLGVGDNLPPRQHPVRVLVVPLEDRLHLPCLRERRGPRRREVPGNVGLLLRRLQAALAAAGSLEQLGQDLPGVRRRPVEGVVRGRLLRLGPGRHLHLRVVLAVELGALRRQPPRLCRGLLEARSSRLDMREARLGLLGEGRDALPKFLQSRLGGVDEAAELLQQLHRAALLCELPPLILPLLLLLLPLLPAGFIDALLGLLEEPLALLQRLLLLVSGILELHLQHRLQLPPHVLKVG